MKIWYDFIKIWHDFKHGIINLIKWFPIIWMDRDWDYQYFYKIIQKKLKSMENLHRFHGHHIDDINTANQMKICITLIEQLMGDDYNKIEFNNYYDKWGRPYYINENHKFSMRKEKIISEKDKIQKNKEFHICLSKENELKLKDKELLFKTITDNIDSWWD